MSLTLTSLTGSVPLYNCTISVSPSNRIQTSIHPHLISKQKLSSDSSLTGAVDAAPLPEAFIEHAKTRFPGKSLASLSNCHGSENQLKPVFSEDALIIPSIPTSKKFSLLARRTILDAAGALEKEGYSPSDFYFFTGTLPGSSAAACEYLSRYSRKFLNAIKTFLGRLGLNLTFNCWEWQLRKKAGLIPALHLHLVIVCTDSSLGDRLPDLLKEKWLDLLEHYSVQSGVSLFEKHERLGGGYWDRESLSALEQKHNGKFEVCKTIRCEKSPAAYLSKYVGKGLLAADEDFQRGCKSRNVTLFYPSSWWSVSKAIRDLIKKHSCVFSFSAPIDQCLDAFNSFTSILDDEKLNLCSLSLSAFVPAWDIGNRIYKNSYCHPEHYEAIKELAASYSGDSDKYPNAYRLSPSRSEQLKAYFSEYSNLPLLSKLYSQLPFYCKSDGTVLDWNSSLVVFQAEKILYESQCFSSYPEPDSLAAREFHLSVLEDKRKQFLSAHYPHLSSN